MGPVVCEPSGDADGAQLTGGRRDDRAVGAICKTEHIVTLYTVHSPPVCHALSVSVWESGAARGQFEQTQPWL